MNPVRRIGLLGFGEVGQRLARDLHERTESALLAYDPKFADPASAPSRALRRLDYVQATESAHGATAGCDLVISAVTAAETIAAARSVHGALRRGACFLDLNSVAPETRRAAAAIVADAGGRFVEAAVMSAIEPRGIASPMLLGGPEAEPALPTLAGLGFTGTRCVPGELGRASATKMCRSVLVKGTEALLAEALLAARHYGVEQHVLDSLQDLFPANDWPAKARYMIARSVAHGSRRAEEMREVARTVREAGIEPWMSDACAEWQSWAALFPAALSQGGLGGLLDEIIRQQRQEAQ
jgi:3-hydroxyisobutyrate dehydrogenase-like beta-hydroxyacid dehydrogenase